MVRHTHVLEGASSWHSESTLEKRKSRLEGTPSVTTMELELPRLPSFAKYEDDSGIQYCSESGTSLRTQGELLIGFVSHLACSASSATSRDFAHDLCRTTGVQPELAALLLP